MSTQPLFVRTSMSTAEIADTILALYATLEANSPVAAGGAAGDPCWPADAWIEFERAISSLEDVEASNAGLTMVTAAIHAGIRWGAAMAAATLMAAPPCRT